MFLTGCTKVVCETSKVAEIGRCNESGNYCRVKFENGQTDVVHLPMIGMKAEVCFNKPNREE
jgi:hypothetical protein